MESEENEGWPPEQEETVGRWAESLEEAVVEVRNMLPFLQYAFSGIEYAAVALRAMELGFDRHTAFWPTVFHKEETYGMAWRDDPELVSSIEPPPDLDPGWKLDPHYGDRIRYWNGEEWDVISAPAAGNLDLFKRIAAGEDVGEVPETVTIHPDNSKESNPMLEMLIGTEETEDDEQGPDPI